MTRLAAALALTAVLAACGMVPGARAGGEIVASTSLLADLAANVAGDRMGVSAIAPQGARVEEYEPKPEDARRISEARLIVVNGEGLDSWMDGLLRNKRSDAVVVVLSAGLPGIEEGGETNPHFWLDVKLAKSYVERIRDGLIAVDASGRSAYEANATAYLAELDALDVEIRQLVEQIPVSERKLVTSHDAFPYFARAYGFEVVGFTQSEEGKDPSAGEIAELVDTVKAAKPRAVFVEGGFPQPVAETLAREAGVAKVVVLPATDGLTVDAGSYIVLMRAFAKDITDALK